MSRVTFQSPHAVPEATHCPHDGERLNALGGCPALDCQWFRLMPFFRVDRVCYVKRRGYESGCGKRWRGYALRPQGDQEDPLTGLCNTCVNEDVRYRREYLERRPGAAARKPSTPKQLPAPVVAGSAL